ncbi:MAG: hypothetical protein ABW136_07655 [Steroidobacteraceae bacterium]
MNRVILYHATLPGRLGAADLSAFQERLPYAKRVGLAASRPERELSLAGIALALAAAKALGHPAPPESLRFPAGERPHFLACAPAFSISHSGRTVVAAATDAGAIGVDVEDPAESSLTDPVRREWSAREAAAKAFGVGLRDAAGIRVDGDRAWLSDRSVNLLALEISSREVWLASDFPAPVVECLAVDLSTELRRHAA